LNPLPIRLLKDGAVVEVPRAELTAELAAGAEFTTARVWLHHNELRRNLSAAKDTAKHLLLLDAGWTVGKRAGFKIIFQKALNRTSGLPL